MEPAQKTHIHHKTPCLERQPRNEDINTRLEIRTSPVIRARDARAAGLDEAGEDVGKDEDAGYETGGQAGDDGVFCGGEDGADEPG